MDLCRDRDCSRVRFGDFVLDRADERVHGPGGPVKIGHKAYRVLVALVEQEGRLLTKEALFSDVWDGTIVSESALTSVIKELRRALGDESRTPRYIESVYGRGYRFLPAVDTVGEDDPAAHGPAEARPSGQANGRPVAVQPPLVLVSRFDDSAIHERFPHCAGQLREEVLSGIARFREIQLVAEGDGPVAFPDGGDRGYRLSATLLPNADGVKIVARVSRLGDGRVVWSENLALAENDSISGVEMLVRRIVGSALPAMDQDIDLGLPEASGGFFERYLIAKRRSLHAAGATEARAAAEELERIVGEQPGFGLAYPPLVRLYNTDFGWTALGASGRRERSRALELAKAGLAADRGNVHAYTVLAFCHLYHGEYALAQGCFEQALDLNPYNPLRVNEVASGVMYLGDFDRAAELLAMGLQLQHFADDSFHEDQGRLALLRGEHEAARLSLSAMARRSIWAELYLVAAEAQLEIPAWRERYTLLRTSLEGSWHDPGGPSDEDLLTWVQWHHPFRANCGDPLFTALREAVAAN
ncbi:MAG TPA: winged helix-turn-helix domain-containing protein [Sphingomicrobium sp.]|nr:winged helix-turn-helix domain-containing protein [Sphingomicrobium sp.]